MPAGLRSEARRARPDICAAACGVSLPPLELFCESEAEDDDAALPRQEADAPAGGGGGGDGETRDAQERALERATKEAAAAVRLHRGIFGDGTSRAILAQIDGAGLPHALRADGDALLAAAAALLSLALRTLTTLASRTAADAAAAKGFARTLAAKSAAACVKGADALTPVVDAARAYGVAIDADEAAAATRAVAELASLTRPADDDDDELD